MSDDPNPGVIGSLPRTRPHRRSDKRPAPAGAPPVDSRAQEPAVVRAATPAKTSAAAKTAATPKAKPARKPATKPRTKPAAAKATPAAAATPTPSAAEPVSPAPRDPSPGLLETAVQAAAELAEIGLHAGARALRGAVSRLPRP